MSSTSSKILRRSLGAWLGFALLSGPAHAKKCREVFLKAFEVPGYFLTHKDVEVSEAFAGIDADGICGQVCLVNALTMTDLVLRNRPIPKRTQLARLRGILDVLRRVHGLWPTDGVRPETMLQLFKGWDDPARERIRLKFYRGHEAPPVGLNAQRPRDFAGIETVFKRIEPADFTASDADFFMVGFEDGLQELPRHFMIAVYERESGLLRLLDPNYPTGTLYRFGRPDREFPGQLVLDAVDPDRAYSPRSVIVAMVSVRYDVPPPPASVVERLIRKLGTGRELPSVATGRLLAQLVEAEGLRSPFFTPRHPLSNKYSRFLGWRVVEIDGKKAYTANGVPVSEAQLAELKLDAKEIHLYARKVGENAYRFRMVPEPVTAETIDEYVRFVDAL